MAFATGAAKAQQFPEKLRVVFRALRQQRQNFVGSVALSAYPKIRSYAEIAPKGAGQGGIFFVFGLCPKTKKYHFKRRL